MSEWRKFNEDVKQAIESPTKKQMLQMHEVHLALYELTQEKMALSKSLDKVDAQIKKYMKTIDGLLDSDPSINWAWRWTFKKSSIKWKEEFINRLGQAEANKVSSVAKQKEYPKIGVQFIDPNPENIPANPDELRKQSFKRLKLKIPKTLTLKERLQLKKGS